MAAPADLAVMIGLKLLRTAGHTSILTWCEEPGRTLGEVLRLLERVLLWRAAMEGGRR